MSNEKKTHPTNVVTGRARFSYVHVFEPHAFDSAPDKAQYSACILIPKDDSKTVGKIQAAINAAITEGKPKWGGKIPPKLWNPLRDGDDEHPEDEAFVGHYFLNAKSNRKPNVVDKNLNPILDTTEFYSGCYGRADVAFYPFSAAGNNGVACALNNVQKLAYGESLGGRRNAEDAFSDGYEDEGGLDDLL